MKNSPDRIKEDKLYVVVTTIQAPTKAMRRLARAAHSCGARLIVVGDLKGPAAYPVGGAEFLNLQRQLDLPWRLPSVLPVNHYARKNVGYLLAISRGASCIYETDDDNAPNATWQPRRREISAVPVARQGWCNVYSYFSGLPLWPRGFPLEEVASSRRWKNTPSSRPRTLPSPIQQGLADGNPDVDAVWRLVQFADVRFDTKPGIALRRGVWCPFNSQSTWWWPDAYPLLYMPTHCTVRVTDIWRSFVAQRCVWEIGGAVSFHSPEVVQDRNAHNLLKDFKDEVPGYLNNEAIRSLLAGLRLQSGRQSAAGNLLRCYEALVERNIFPKEELPLLKAWLSDLKTIQASVPARGPSAPKT
jgi:hypothetical protein